MPYSIHYIPFIIYHLLYIIYHLVYTIYYIPSFNGPFRISRIAGREASFEAEVLGSTQQASSPEFWTPCFPILTDALSLKRVYLAHIYYHILGITGLLYGPYTTILGLQ